RLCGLLCTRHEARVRLSHALAVTHAGRSLRLCGPPRDLRPRDQRPLCPIAVPKERRHEAHHKVVRGGQKESQGAQTHISPCSTYSLCCCDNFVNPLLDSSIFSPIRSH